MAFRDDEDFWDIEPSLLSVEDSHNYAIVDEEGLRDVGPDEYYDKKIGGIAGAIAASMAKWARKPADLYQTPVEATYSVIPYVEDLLPAGSRILEPACAEGQMSKALEEFGYAVDSYDLRPDAGYGIGGVDFLSNPTFRDGQYDAVWTNPPFSAASQFIERGLEIAPIVVLLLKSNYWFTKGRKALFRKHPPIRQFNLTWRLAFLKEERGNSPLMDCAWFVWQRGYQGLPTVDMLDRIDECPRTAEWYGGL